jgi:hypothetical protein
MKVQLYGNLHGNAGTQRTVNVMRRLVREGRTDPTIVFLARQIARKFDRRDYRGQARGIHLYVRDHIHYAKDPRGTEAVASPIWTLYHKAGDCDDQAILVASLAEAIGFETRFKAIKVDPRFPGEFSHVYAQIRMPGSGAWVTSDTIVPGKDLGWEAEDMFGSRTWEGLGMYSTLYGLGDEPAQAASQQSFWGNIGNALKSTLMDGTQNVVSNLMTRLRERTGTTVPTQPTVAPSSGIPSWLLPVGVVAGAVGLAILVKRKRR